MYFYHVNSSPVTDTLHPGLNLLVSNTAQVNLCFEAGKRVVDVNGAIVRDFRPDEPTLARRLRAVTCEDGVGDANNTRGMEVGCTSPGCFV
jgi:hypothetical protein